MNGPFFVLQLNNARRKRLVRHFLGVLILVRNVNVRSLYGWAVHRVPNERLGWRVASDGLFPTGQRYLVQFPRVSINIRTKPHSPQEGG